MFNCASYNAIEGERYWTTFWNGQNWQSVDVDRLMDTAKKMNLISTNINLSNCPYCATSSTRVNLRGQVECSGCGSPR